jgi:diacylglycerol kinase
MRKIIENHTLSFRHAFRGLFWAFQTQPNFRIHGVLGACAILLGIVLRVTHVEMAVLVFTTVLGIAGELINTALEEMTDLITKEWREEAKIAKDVSAGMMLFIAFGSLFVAFFIFGPYIVSLIL